MRRIAQRLIDLFVADTLLVFREMIEIQEIYGGLVDKRGVNHFTTSYRDSTKDY